MKKVNFLFPLGGMVLLTSCSDIEEVLFESAASAAAHGLAEKIGVEDEDKSEWVDGFVSSFSYGDDNDDDSFLDDFFDEDDDDDDFFSF